MGAHTDSGWEWDFRWRRSLFDSEVINADSFLNDIEGKTVHPCRRDEWVWKAEPSGIYSTQSVYGLLWGELTGANQEAVFKDLWKLKISPKTSVFAWRLIKDRLPTKLNLRRRQVEVSDTLCPFCCNYEEGAVHLFFKCSKILPI